MAGDSNTDDTGLGGPEVLTHNPFSSWWSRLLYRAGLRNKLLAAGVVLPSVFMIVLLGVFYLAVNSWITGEARRTVKQSMLHYSQNRLTRVGELKNSLEYLSHHVPEESADASDGNVFEGHLPGDAKYLLTSEQGELAAHSPDLERPENIVAALAHAPSEAENTELSDMLATGDRVFEVAFSDREGGGRLLLLRPLTRVLNSGDDTIRIGLNIGGRSAPLGSDELSGRLSRLEGEALPSAAFSSTVFPEGSSIALTSQRVSVLTPDGRETALLNLGLDLTDYRSSRFTLYALTLGGIGLVMLILLFAVGTGLTSHMLNPLGSLMSRMEQVRREGALDLEQIENPPADRDLHELFETFNYMLLSLQVTQQQLSDLNQHLNEKVEERTEELRSLYQESQETNEQLRKMTSELESAYSRLQEYAASLRRAQRSQSEFFAKISHELRTPLNAIIGFSELLRQDAEEVLSEQQLSDLNTIYQNGKHLLEMVTELLDYSKIEAGRMEFDKRMCSLRPVLTNALDIVRPLAEEKGLKVETDLADDLPKLYLDEVRIRQSMINLLSNAIKFTDKGYIRLEAHRGEEEVTIKVIDTGVGISEEQQEEIFQEFTQINTGSDSQSGTGLGLPITKYFIEEHGGRITVESSLGQGSEFTVSLPTLSPEEAEADDDSDVAEDGLPEVEPGPLEAMEEAGDVIPERGDIND